MSCVRSPRELSGRDVEVRGVPVAAAERRRVREEMRPDDRRGEAEVETPKVGDGETKDGLKATTAGAPAATVAFSELEGDSAMGSSIER